MIAFVPVLDLVIAHEVLRLPLGQYCLVIREQI